MNTLLILGGGISGLATAWFYAQRFPKAKITLLEKTDRLGGCIATQSVGPFLFETGPRTFARARSPELLSLIDALGLTPDLIFSDPAAKTRYLWVGGRLRKISSFWPTLGLAAARDVLTPKRVATEEESIYAFASRRFGTEAAELFFDPLVKGIFAGESRKLSLSACFPLLHQLERTHRSIIKGFWARSTPKSPGGLFTLRGGMQQLVEALCKTPMEIELECPVEAIFPNSVVAGGRTWTADRIVSALPGQEVAKLCGVPLALRNEPISVVNLGFKKKIELHGYGYLVPTREKEELLGQIWDSAVFPADPYTYPYTRVTSMVRSAEPEEVALDAMRRHVGENGPPDAVVRKDGLIPQYDVGHGANLEAFEAALRDRFPRLQLVGNYFLSPSVEACIEKAKSVVYH